MENISKLFWIFYFFIVYLKRGNLLCYMYFPSLLFYYIPCFYFVIRFSYKSIVIRTMVNTECFLLLHHYYPWCVCVYAHTHAHTHAHTRTHTHTHTHNLLSYSQDFYFLCNQGIFFYSVYTFILYWKTRFKDIQKSMQKGVTIIVCIIIYIDRCPTSIC